MGQNQKAKTEHYEEIEDYDYNNPNDTSNYCPGLEVRGEELLPLLLFCLFPYSGERESSLTSWPMLFQYL